MILSISPELITLRRPEQAQYDEWDMTFCGEYIGRLIFYKARGGVHVRCDWPRHRWAGGETVYEAFGIAKDEIGRHIRNAKEAIINAINNQQGRI